MTTRPTVEPAGVSEVRRYTCSRDDGGYMYEYTELGNMVPDEDVSDNHFVLASDYDALRQQLAEMRVAVAVLRPYIYPPGGRNDYAEEKYDKAMAVINAALAPTSQPERQVREGPHCPTCECGMEKPERQGLEKKP